MTLSTVRYRPGRMAWITGEFEMRRIRLVSGIAVGLASAYALSAGGLYFAMNEPPERFGAIMARVPSAAMMVLPFKSLWMRARQGNLRVGDRAPDFILPRLDGTGSIRLSAEWQDRPVVLIFGSYT
jgi:hypothetical protein